MNQLSADAVASQDLLGRDQFAARIVRSLVHVFKHQSESFVVGIAGKWGSGKSTLLGFIEKHLHQAYQGDRERYRVIRFNPWSSTTPEAEELQRELLSTLIRELEQIHWKRKVTDADNKLKSYAKYLQYLRYLKYVHPLAEKVSDAVEEFSKKVTVHSLEEVRAQADELIKEKGIKLYILLDDLDRLTPEELAVVFKVIKLNVNFAHTCFLVAYDKAVVLESLKKITPYADTYLEKIIQVDFTIPEILEEQLQVLFFVRLRELFYDLELKLEEESFQSIWKYYGLRQYFHTLRDLNRYFNSLIFSLPNIGAEVNLADFLVLEAIKVFDFAGYEKLYYDYLHKRREAVWSKSNFDEAAIQSFEDLTTRALLRYLFPQGRYEAVRGYDPNQKRLQDPEFFARYYTLHLPSQDVSEETLKRFLTLGQNRRQVLEEVVRHGKLSSLLHRLADSGLNRHYTIDDPYLFDVLLQFFNEHEPLITPELEEDLWRAYFNLAHSFKDVHEGARQAVRELILNEGTGHPLKFVFNHYIHRYLDEGKADTQLGGKVEEQLQLAKKELTERFIEYLNRNWSSYLYRPMRNAPTFLTDLFLHSWATYVSEGYEKEIGRFLEDYQFAVYFLKSQFLSVSQKNNKPMRINLQHKDRILPGELWGWFIEILKNAPSGAWSEEDREHVVYFLEALQPIVPLERNES